VRTRLGFEVVVDVALEDDAATAASARAWVSLRAAAIERLAAALRY